MRSDRATNERANVERLQPEDKHAGLDVSSTWLEFDWRKRGASDVKKQGLVDIFAGYPAIHLVTGTALSELQGLDEAIHGVCVAPPERVQRLAHPGAELVDFFLEAILSEQSTDQQRWVLFADIRAAALAVLEYMPFEGIERSEQRLVPAAPEGLSVISECPLLEYLSETGR